MNTRLQGPHNDPDDDHSSRRNDDDEIDLRYRYYEIDEDEDYTDDYEPPQRRAVDGWSTESESTSPWWLKAGIAVISILIVLGLVAGLAGPFLGSFGSNEPERIEYVPAQVVEVVDVRTIIVDIDGTLATVRYIGVEPLPLESAWYDIGILAHQQLVGNSEVLLEARRDRHRRLRTPASLRLRRPCAGKRTVDPQRNRFASRMNKTDWTVITPTSESGQNQQDSINSDTGAAHPRNSQTTTGA